MAIRPVDELVKDDRLHRTIYNDAEIFEEELRRIFYTTWLYIGHESEIAQPGDYKTARMGRVPVILSRGSDGELHLLINRCMHRGTTVCQRSRGNGNYFKCEYHGWVYGSDGELTGVTQASGYGPGEIDTSQLGLRRVPRVASYRGFVFGSLAPAGPTLEEHLGLAKDYLASMADKSPTGMSLVAGGYYQHNWEGNWKLQLEGAVDGYHAPFLHAAVFSNRGDDSGMRTLTRLGTTPSGGRRQNRAASFMNSPDRRSIDLGNGHGVIEQGLANTTWEILETQYPKEYLDSLEQRLGRERTRVVLGRWWRISIFPNVAFGSDNNIRVIDPLGATKSQYTQYHVLAENAPIAVNTALVRGHEDFYGPAGFGSPDDLEMFARIQQGMKAVDYAPWVLLVRGHSTEEVGSLGERFGDTRTEAQNRGMYRAYRRIMKGESHITNPALGAGAEA